MLYLVHTKKKCQNMTIRDLCKEVKTQMSSTIFYSRVVYFVQVTNC
jgi:hypothetical protein